MTKYCQLDSLENNLERSSSVNDGLYSHGVGKFLLTGHEFVLRLIEVLLGLELALNSCEVVLKGSSDYILFASRGADLESNFSLLDENQEQCVAFV